MTFYPRSPRGERLDNALYNRWDKILSIHALREESDVTICAYLMISQRFLSTLSARRAT